MYNYPNTPFHAEFTTQIPGGVATDADSLPVATATKNGVDDAAFVLTVTKMDTGRYKITGTVPAGYAAGDHVDISVAATVSTIAGKDVVAATQIVSATQGTAGSNLDASVASRSTLAAGAKMDIVDAPNATAVTAIQAGLSKPGTAQTITAPATMALEATSVLIKAKTDIVENTVLDALLANHTQAGSLAAGIAAAGSAGNPWTDPLTSYPPGTAGYQISRIGTAGAIIRQPIVVDSTISIVRGSSYFDADGRSIQFDLTGDTTIPSLVGASVSFIGAKNAQSVPIESLTVAGTIAGRILKIELSSAQTLEFTAGNQRYDIVITLLNGHAIHYVNRSVLKVCPAVA